MTATQHGPRAASNIPEQSPRIGEPPTSVDMTQHANCINGASLDDMAGRFCSSWVDTSGTLSFSFTRTTQARYLCLRALIQTIGSLTGTLYSLKLDLSVTDGTDTVASTDDRIPYGFRNEVLFVPDTTGGSLVGTPSSREVVGYIDLDALVSDPDATGNALTGVDWIVSVDVTVTGTGSCLQLLHAWEAPCFAVDDAVPGRGVLLGNFTRDLEVIDTPSCVEALIDADDYAVTAQRTILSVAWRQQVADSTETPSCAATAYGAISLLDEGGSVGHFRTFARALPDPTTGEVPIRFRVLYRFSGGATTETANVRLDSGATGGPWATSALAYTTTWTWSPWIDAVHLSGADEITWDARVSAGGPTLWLGAIAVVENCAP